MLRHRDRNESDQFSPYAYRYYNNTGKLLDKSDSSHLSYHSIDEINDVVTKDYHSRKARGELILNPLTRIRERTTEQPASGVKTYTNGYYITFDGMVTSAMLLAAPPDSTEWSNFRRSVADEIAQATSDCKADAINNIDRTPYSFLEDVAELRSTMKTLANPLHSAKVAADKFYRKTRDREGFYLKRKGLRRAEALARAAGDAWLSSRYEFRPIMYSVRDIYLRLPKIHAKPSKRMKASSFKTVTRSISGVLTVPESHMYYNHNGEVNFTCHVVIYYRMANNFDYKDWDLGIRLKDVPATTWALMPYSWLIDKFVDVSSSIRGLTNLADPRLQILGGCVTIDHELTHMMQVVSPPYQGWSGTLTGGERVIYDHYVNRANYCPSYTDALQPFTVKEALSDPSSLLDTASVILQRLTFGGRLAKLSANLT